MSDVVILLQSRTASRRLPAKAMLTLSGMPMALLAARRAANAGHKVLTLTSDSPEDDTLAATLAEGGFTVFRGANDDVLGRFVQATANLPAHTVLVRLTADNPLPDGDFVRWLVSNFSSANQPYWCPPWPDSGLPYGLVGEVFTVAALREADRHTRELNLREHVTPWLRSMYRPQRPVVPLPDDSYESGLASLSSPTHRATCDTLSDYLRLCRVFASVPEPVTAPWQALARYLVETEGGLLEPAASPALGVHSRFVLGTAQLGMSYGATNRSGKPADQEAGVLLQEAMRAGINVFDTAPAYGEAESRLGAGLHGSEEAKIITKLTVSDEALALGSRAIRAEVEASVFRSLTRMRRDHIDAVLLHKAEQRHIPALVEALDELRAAGRIGALGVSIYTPDEAHDVLNDARWGVLEHPYNLASARQWHSVSARLMGGERGDVSVLVRSVFLQGVLVHGPQRWNGRLAPTPDLLAMQGWLRQAARRLERRSLPDVCLAFVRAQPWIHGVVVGVDSPQQLRQNIDLFTSEPLSLEEATALMAGAPEVADNVLDPRRWQAAPSPATRRR